jgi:hypothetical protein
MNLTRPLAGRRKSCIFAAMGAALSVGMAGVRIAAMGTTFIPDPEIYIVNCKILGKSIEGGQYLCRKGQE